MNARHLFAAVTLGACALTQSSVATAAPKGGEWFETCVAGLNRSDPNYYTKVVKCCVDSGGVVSINPDGKYGGCLWDPGWDETSSKRPPPPQLPNDRKPPPDSGSPVPG